MIALKASAADTLLVFATPKFSSLAIRKASELDWHPLHFVGQPGSAIESVIRPAGVEKAVGLDDRAAAKGSRRSRLRQDAEVVDTTSSWRPGRRGDNAKDTGAIAGYVTAQESSSSLRRCGEVLTRENVLKQATTLDECG